MAPVALLKHKFDHLPLKKPRRSPQFPTRACFAKASSNPSMSRSRLGPRSGSACQRHAVCANSGHQDEEMCASMA